MELVYKWITLANRHYYLYLNRALAPFGLNSSQYLFIINLCRDPGITQDKLPDRICVNKSNVARTLAQLEKKGLIRRQVNPGDKRTAAVFPTKRARELYKELFAELAREDADALVADWRGQLDGWATRLRQFKALAAQKHHPGLKTLEALLAKEFPNVVARVSPLELGPPVGSPVQYRSM